MGWTFIRAGAKQFHQQLWATGNIITYSTAYHKLEMLSDCTAPFLIHFHTDATADAITPARGELSLFELNGRQASFHSYAIPIDAKRIQVTL